MNRGEVLFWLVLDALTLEPIIRAGTREDARDLARDEETGKMDGVLASVRYER